MKHLSFKNFTHRERLTLPIFYAISAVHELGLQIQETSLSNGSQKAFTRRPSKVKPVCFLRVFVIFDPSFSLLS